MNQNPDQTNRDDASASDLASRFCARPFDFLAIDAAREGWVCCHDWLPVSIGPIGGDDWRDGWNSDAAQRIRESILDGSFRYCRQDRCPAIIQGTLPRRSDVSARHRNILDNRITRLDDGPQTLSLGYDNSCNLKCPTCRSHLIQIRGEAFDRAIGTQEFLSEANFLDARTLIVTGHGDAFGSRVYKTLLRNFQADEHPGLEIIIMTNGILLDAAMWESIGGAQKAIRGITVSIDAATAPTYALNRGASFERLVGNLEFMAGLHRSKRLDWFEISFVVQDNNFLEMPEFVRLGRSLGCSSILFQKLFQWESVMDEKTYRLAAVHEVGHPRHDMLVAVLREPTLAGEDIDLSNLDYLAERETCAATPALSAL